MNKSNWVNFKFARSVGFRPPISSLASGTRGLVSFRVAREAIDQEKKDPTLIERPVDEPINQFPIEAKKVIKSTVLDSGLGRSHLKGEEHISTSEKLDFLHEDTDDDDDEMHEDAIDNSDKIVVKTIEIGGAEKGEEKGQDHSESRHNSDSIESTSFEPPPKKKVRKEVTPSKKYKTYKLRIV